MAQEHRMTDDIPLIEEQVETGLKAMLQGYKSPHNPVGEKKDELFNRFTILPDQRLEMFDHPFAKGYQAVDDNNLQRSVYAMVCERGLPYRDIAMQNMFGVNKHEITPLLGTGTVFCSFLNEARQVIFLERPNGIRLSDSLKLQPRLHEHRILDYVIQPILQGLLVLREKKTSHGNICAENLYISDSSVLGECYSAPPGTLTHYLYHPLERLMCGHLGFGEANEKTDIFALGMLTYELMYGLEKVKSVPKDDYIRMVMNFGTYQLLTNNRSQSEAFQDFFRGILNDNPIERWGIDQLVQWSSGKRFNMTAPVQPKESTRPITFLGETFFNRRLFGNALHRYWREARKDIKALKIDRWIESGIHKPELAVAVERLLRIGGEASNESQLNDMLTRVIGILDPTAPIRTMLLSVRPDSIGITLADTIRGETTPELSQLMDVIETDVSSYWAELSEANKYGDMAPILWRLQRAKTYLKRKNFGFGLERVLYELNPSLPCHSPLLYGYHITTAQDALKALDAIAQTVGPTTSFMDRHLAAFIACKIDMGKEIRMSDLVSVKHMEHHEELIVLKILAKAQQKYNLFPLVGLSAWVAMRVELMLDDVHNRILRKKLKLQLKKLSYTGKIAEAILPILSRDVAQNDMKGFTQAIALHQITYKRIERYENPDLIEYYAREMGGKLAAFISYMILFVSCYVTFMNGRGL
jgi:hypothetical protein